MLLLLFHQLLRLLLSVRTPSSGSHLQIQLYNNRSVIFATLYSTVIVLAGIVVTNTGDVYVSAPEQHQIARFSSASNEFTMVAGNGTRGYRDGPASTAMFNYPTGLALDPSSGRIYIADQLNHCVRIYDPHTASVSTLIRDLPYPHAVQYVNRQLFVLHGPLNGTRIGRLDADGSLSVILGNYSIGDGPLPTRSANIFGVGAAGAILYVTQYQRNSIDRIDVRTGVITDLKSVLNPANVDKIMFGPLGVVVASANHHDAAFLYVYESNLAYEIDLDLGSLRILSGYQDRVQYWHHPSPDVSMRAAVYTNTALYFIDHDDHDERSLYKIRRMSLS